MSNADYLKKSFWDRAEENSHAAAGLNASPVESFLSHAFGYVFTPFRDALSYVIPDRKTQVSVNKILPAFNQDLKKRNYFNFYKHQMSKRRSKTTKTRKRNQKNLVRKTVRSMLGNSTGGRRLGPPLPRRLMRKRNQRTKSSNFRTSLGNRKSLVEKVIAPPVAEGYILNVGPRVDFMQVNRPGCIKLTGRVCIGNVSSVLVGTATQTVLTTSGTTVSGAFPIAPQLAKYFPSTTATMASLFERYEIDCQFEYVPKVATSTAGSFMMSILQDPAAVNDVFGIANDAGTASLTIMRNMARSVEGPHYGRLFSPIFRKKKRDDMNYISGIYIPSTGVLDWTDTSASLRDQIAGVLMFSIVNTNANVALGDLYIRYHLTLCDMIVAPTASDGLFSVRRTRAKALASLGEKSAVLMKMASSYEAIHSIKDDKSQSRSSSRTRKEEEEEKSRVPRYFGSKEELEQDLDDAYSRVLSQREKEKQDLVKLV